MKKSIAVLGLGKYGRSLVENLYELGADVMAVDRNEELIQDFSGSCTSAICANLANEEEVLSLGLKSMDIVVVAIGDDLAASIVSITVAKEQGVPLVIAKTSSPRISSILRKVGADRILDPEGEGGARSARILMSSFVRDVFELDKNMSMLEMVPKSEWIGESLTELNLRSRMNLNVVAEKEKGGCWRFPDADKPITPELLLLVVAEKKSLKKLDISSEESKGQSQDLFLY